MSYIYSKFAADEDWQELLHDLVNDLPKRLEAIDAAIAKVDVKALAYLVHQLKGACGSYGYDEVTTLAGQLEISMHHNSDFRAWQRDLTNFRDALQRMTDQPAPTDCTN